MDEQQQQGNVIPPVYLMIRQPQRPNSDHFKRTFPLKAILVLAGCQMVCAGMLMLCHVSLCTTTKMLSVARYNNNLS